MVRLVRLDDRAPLKIDASTLEERGGQVWVCRCGLSAAWPWCDNTHAQAKGEGQDTWRYWREEPAGEVRREQVPSQVHVDPRPQPPVAPP